MPLLVTRLVRRHPLTAGRLLVGLVDDAGYVRDTSSTAVGSLFTDGTSGQIAVMLRALTSTLDLRRRDAMQLCAVTCRTGPVVWLPSDVCCREAIGSEAAARVLRVGEVFLITEAGWRSSSGDAGRRPMIDPAQPTPWDRPVP